MVWITAVAMATPANHAVTLSNIGVSNVKTYPRASTCLALKTVANAFDILPDIAAPHSTH
jgi:hypothetical protein